MAEYIDKELFRSNLEVDAYGRTDIVKIGRAMDKAKVDVTDINVGNKWVPVTERLPEKAVEYLCRCIVCGRNYMPFHMVLRYILIDENPHFQHETKGGMKVTHWMPLPDAPKED